MSAAVLSVLLHALTDAKLSHTKTAHVGGARDGHRSSAPNLRECSPSLMGNLPRYAVGRNKCSPCFLMRMLLNLK